MLYSGPVGSNQMQKPQHKYDRIVQICDNNVAIAVIVS